jgi:epoxyqueuosine reductase
VKASVQQRARELGFDDCRVADAAPPATGSHLQRWLAQGRHGKMAYLERNADKRVDPQKVLTDARSIISLAVSYSADKPQISVPHAEFRPPNSSGSVARYARFADYHKVIGDKLKSLTAFVNELGGTGTRSLWYVDTGPLLERDLAQRSGLGFVGKHTNLISRHLGNWIFLSEIITTAALVPDEPEKNRCGSCTRCLAACPTAAITAPFQLDARRCISYLTIELKGPIPV